MYNYKKKEGKFDKIRKILGYTYRKAKVEKNEKWNRGSFESNQKMDFGLSMDKGSSYAMLCYIIPLSTMNWFDRSNIRNIELIQYYQNASPPLEFTGYPFFLSMGLHPELLWKKK